jgi:hypothetical protein
MLDGATWLRDCKQYHVAEWNTAQDFKISWFLD